jgi:hypothetical protein
VLAPDLAILVPHLSRERDRSLVSPATHAHKVSEDPVIRAPPNRGQFPQATVHVRGDIDPFITKPSGRVIAFTIYTEGARSAHWVSIVQQGVGLQLAELVTISVMVRSRFWSRFPIHLWDTLYHQNPSRTKDG